MPLGSLNERTIILHLRTKYDGRPIARAADDLDKVDKSSGKAGKSLDRMGDDAARLRTELDKTNQRVQDFHSQIAKTGDLSLFRNINEEERRARQLRRVLASITPDVGSDFVTRLGMEIGELPSKLRGVAYLSVGVFAAAAAPAIAGIISGAVLGAVGAGGVVGGAVLAAQDSRVALAWKKLGGDLLTQLTDAAGGFVDPLQDAAKTVGDAFRAGGLADAIRESAVLVDPVARAVGGMVRDLGPGLRAAIQGSRPVWAMLATELPETGEAIGSMLTSMARASDGATVAFDDFLDVVQAGTVATGNLFAGLSEVYLLTRQPLLAKALDVVPMFGALEVIGKLSGGTQAYIRHVDMASTSVDLLNSGEKRNIAAAKELEASRRDAAKAMQDYNRAVDDAVSNAARLDASEDSVKLAMMDLSQSVKDNGKVWGDNTRAGLENREALRRVLTTIDDVRRAQIGSGVDAQTANAAYNKQVEQLRTLGRRLGLTKGQIDDLIDDYKITITTHWVTRGSPPRLISSGAFAGDFRVEYGRILQRQHGGPVEPGGTYLVGEGGRPEILQMGPQARGHITPLLAGTSRGGDGGMLTLLVRSGGQSAFERFMADWIRRYVSIQGGGNVQKAFGKAT